MTRFRVHLDDGEIVPVDADTPADAAAHVRKTRKDAIVRKVKRDKSVNKSPRQIAVETADLQRRIANALSDIRSKQRDIINRNPEDFAEPYDE